jgi:hypothetical protein
LLQNKAVTHSKSFRVGVIQSCYLPWRGFFDFIADVDLFILYDDIQYSTGSWRNRNRLKTPVGVRWLTVPVPANAGKMPIDRVPIGHPRTPWKEEHRLVLKRSLAGARFQDEALSIWEESIAFDDTHLSQLNERLIRRVCSFLGIETPIVQARPYLALGTKTDRLIDLLKKVGASTYLSGPRASAYINPAAFAQEGIGLEYKVYDYKPYPQLWGDFEGSVSVLDLIANCGPDARQHLRSLKSSQVVIPSECCPCQHETSIPSVKTNIESKCEQQKDSDVSGC